MNGCLESSVLHQHDNDEMIAGMLCLHGPNQSKTASKKWFPMIRKAKPRFLTALPVYNEVTHLGEVLDLVKQHADDILVVDDGSSDGSTEELKKRDDISLLCHETNQGYGAALRSAFCYARRHNYEVVVTIDCDGQHEPQRIRQLAEMLQQGSEVDIVSGSRYLDGDLDQTGEAPVDRRHINKTITRELNEQLGLSITDAFCGFKAYRVSALKPLRLAEDGYAMPLELWAQAARHKLSIQEVAVPLIYLDEERSFGGELDDAARRLAHYRKTIQQAIDRLDKHQNLPEPDPCSKLMAQTESVIPASS